MKEVHLNNMHAAMNHAMDRNGYVHEKNLLYNDK